MLGKPPSRSAELLPLPELQDELELPREHSTAKCTRRFETVAERVLAKAEAASQGAHADDPAEVGLLVTTLLRVFLSATTSPHSVLAGENCDAGEVMRSFSGAVAPPPTLLEAIVEGGPVEVEEIELGPATCFEKARSFEGASSLSSSQLSAKPRRSAFSAEPLLRDRRVGLGACGDSWDTAGALIELVIVDRRGGGMASGGSLRGKVPARRSRHSDLNIVDLLLGRLDASPAAWSKSGADAGRGRLDGVSTRRRCGCVAAGPAALEVHSPGII